MHSKMIIVVLLMIGMMMIYQTHLDYNQELKRSTRNHNEENSRNLIIDSILKHGRVCKDIEPVTAIGSWRRTSYKGKEWKGRQLPILTSSCRTKLGNFMGEYSTLYALHRAYNVSVMIDEFEYKRLTDVFPNVTLEQVPEEARKSEVMKDLPSPKFTRMANFEAAAAGLMGPEFFTTKLCLNEVQLFHAYQCDLKKEFTFAPVYQEMIQNYWTEKKDSIKDAVVVGVHIRRTDYIGYVMNRRGYLPGASYYRRAMEFFTKRLSKVIFIVASDDMKYVMKTFENRTDVIYAPGKNKVQDMGILASCDHNIMTLGSFGFFCSFLGKGLVVYPEYVHMRDYTLQKNYYELAGMDFFIPVDDRE